MSLFGKLFGRRAASEAVTAVTAGVRSIRNTFAKTLDVETAAQLDQHLAQLQSDVNQIEAGHGSVFVAGWRPAVGWVCALALAYHYLIAPLVGGIFGATMPAVEIGELYPVLLGILGLGGMRSWEKYKQVQDRH